MLKTFAALAVPPSSAIEKIDATLDAVRDSVAKKDSLVNERLKEINK